MKPSKRKPSGLTLLDPSNPFDPEEITEPHNSAKEVQDLWDKDALVMLGKMAREIARQGAVLDELVEYTNARARKESLAHQWSSIKGGSIVGIVVAIFEGLKAAGIIK